MNADLFKEAADLAALIRAVQRAGAAIAGDGRSGDDALRDAGVIAHDIERLAAIAADRADALAHQLAGA